MKYFLSILALFAFTAFVTGCINSSTSFSNRGVTWQVTPELQGEHSYVADSPHANDTSLEAGKTLDAKTNASGTGSVTDNSSNQQDEYAPEKEEKKEEAPKQEETPEPATTAEDPSPVNSDATAEAPEEE